MWVISAFPLAFLVWLGVRGWVRVRPGNKQEAFAWTT
jgi:hypothetical protein